MVKTLQMWKPIAKFTRGVCILFQIPNFNNVNYLTMKYPLTPSKQVNSIPHKIYLEVPVL